MTRGALVIADDHPAFAGHFPARPIVPGVVLLDVALRAMAADGALRSLRLTIASAKFLSFVGPGETVRLESDDAHRLRIYAGDGAGERLAVTAVLRVADAS